MKFLLWLGGAIWRELTAGGLNAGETLPSKGVPSIPHPYAERTRDRAQALATENKVLQNDAEVDHAATADELRKQAEVKDEEGRVTGFHFHDN
jgi:hypothetical protein